MSLYADDAALFIRPTAEDAASLRQILFAFGDATGLNTNIHKSELFPIRCDELDLQPIMMA